MRSLINISAVVLAASVIAGCNRQVEISHGPLEAPNSLANFTVQVGDLAANVRKEAPDLVGTQTFSVLGIPVGDVRTEEPLPKVLHPFVVEALETAGYAVVDIRGKKAAEVPVLRGEVRTFWFGLYTWVAPIMYYGGNIEHCLILQSPEGNILWQHSFKATAGNVGSWDGAIRPAVTDVLNQMIKAMASDEFKQAMRNPHATTVSSDGAPR